MPKVKMRLAFIQTCTEDQHTYPQEVSVRAEWMEQALEVGNMVSMDEAEPCEKRWQVVQVHVYQPTGLKQLEEINLVQVCRADLPIPPKAEWLAYYMREDYPDEAIYAQAVAVKEPIVGLGYAVDGHRPRIGENIPSDWEQLAEIDEFGTAPVRPIPGELYINSFDTYLPVADAPYPTFYLAWCKAGVQVA